jgi:hypothetical protein
MSLNFYKKDLEQTKRKAIRPFSTVELAAAAACAISLGMKPLGDMQPMNAASKHEKIFLVGTIPSRWKKSSR